MYGDSEGIPEIIASYHFEIEERRHDQIPFPTSDGDQAFAKKLILRGEYHELLTFVEFCLGHEQCSETLHNSLIHAFDKSPIAYFVEIIDEKPCVMPRISCETGEATRDAIEVLCESNMSGATVHLRRAAQLLNSQKFGESIQHSMHAVESVVKNLTLNSKNKFSDALDSLARKGQIKHPALLKGLKALYGFTSNEQGIRHALHDKVSAEVDLDEAILMFGICASIAAYLVRKNP